MLGRPAGHPRRCAVFRPLHWPTDVPVHHASQVAWCVLVTALSNCPHEHPDHRRSHGWTNWKWLLRGCTGPAVGTICHSVPQSCPTLCDFMDCSTSGFPVLPHLPELAQTHVHWVSDAIQPSHPLSYPSPPAFNLSQYQGLFQWVGSSHQVAKVLVQNSIQSSFSPTFYSGSLPSIWSCLLEFPAWQKTWQSKHLSVSFQGSSWTGSVSCLPADHSLSSAQ